ncbi:uncharacterized protein LOC144479034 isoform X1 [Augochlora pura]
METHFPGPFMNSASRYRRLAFGQKRIATLSLPTSHLESSRPPRGPFCRRRFASSSSSERVRLNLEVCRGCSLRSAHGLRTGCSSATVATKFSGSKGTVCNLDRRGGSRGSARPIRFKHLESRVRRLRCVHLFLARKHRTKDHCPQRLASSYEMAVQIADRKVSKVTKESTE